MGFSGWIIFTRFILIVPFSVFAGISIDLFAQIAKDKDGPGVPRWRELYISQAVNGIVGIVAATWAIIALVMSCSRLYRPRSVFFFYHFIIDIKVLAALISAAVLATPNAPNTIAQCVRMNTLRYSHRPLLFRYLGRIKSETSLSACERLLTIRILAIVSIILTGIIAMLTFFKIAIPPTLRGILVFTGRAAQKGCWPHRRQRTMPSHQAALDRDVEKLETGLLYQKPDLAYLFKVDRISTSITNNLHFSDIINICLTSRSTYAAILPPSSSTTINPRFERLRISTCFPGTKLQCWSCGTQICRDCQTTKALPNPATTAHLEHCSSYCTSCFYRTICIAPHRDTRSYDTDRWTRSKECLHFPIRTTSYYPDRFEDITKLTEDRSVCRRCTVLDQVEVVKLREAREMVEIRFLMLRQARCAECRRELPEKGRRWWACAICKKDCGWEGHPSWGGEGR